MSKKTHLPIPVQKVLRTLGKNISDARRRRRIAMELMSERCGFSRLTLSKAESVRSKSMGEAARTLSEVDYLLGVNDEARQGALRFSLQDGGPYLTPKDKESKSD